MAGASGLVSTLDDRGNGICTDKSNSGRWTYTDSNVEKPTTERALGVTYCVVPNSGGDFFSGREDEGKELSGEGTVLVLGGVQDSIDPKSEGADGEGWLVFETRKKRGT